MIRHIKLLSRATIVVVALSAVTASAAGAAQFTSSSYPTSITAASSEGNEVFATEAGSLSCLNGHFAGTMSEPSPTITITPTFTSCSGWSFMEATVTMNGCDFIFHATGVFDLECSGSNKVVIVAGTCEVQVGTQTGLVGIDLTNSGANIMSQATVGGIAYTVTKDGFFCPFSGTGNKTGARYTQKNAVRFGSLNGAAISVDP